MSLLQKPLMLKKVYITWNSTIVCVLLWFIPTFNWGLSFSIFIEVCEQFKGTIKVQLNKKDGSELGKKITVERFPIEVAENSLFETLHSKICNKFEKELQSSTNGFDIFWKDSEDEIIRVSDNEGLLDALKDMEALGYRLYALINGQ